jgi:hypothetical protein
VLEPLEPVMLASPGPEPEPLVLEFEPVDPLEPPVDEPELGIVHAAKLSEMPELLLLPP